MFRKSYADLGDILRHPNDPTKLVRYSEVNETFDGLVEVFFGPSQLSMDEVSTELWQDLVEQAHIRLSKVMPASAPTRECEAAMLELDLLLMMGHRIIRASKVGNPKVGNYVMSETFLDQMARCRLMHHIAIMREPESISIH